MGQMKKMKSLQWKEMRNFDCEWSINKNFITLKNEVNNMAARALRVFFTLYVTRVMKGIIVKLTTFVMQYILNEKHMGNFLF